MLIALEAINTLCEQYGEDAMYRLAVHLQTTFDREEGFTEEALKTRHTLRNLALDIDAVLRQRGRVW